MVHIYLFIKIDFSIMLLSCLRGRISLACLCEPPAGKICASPSLFFFLNKVNHLQQGTVFLLFFLFLLKVSDKIFSPWFLNWWNPWRFALCGSFNGCGFRSLFHFAAFNRNLANQIQTARGVAGSWPYLEFPLQWRTWRSRPKPSLQICRAPAVFTRD